MENPRRARAAKGLGACASILCAALAVLGSSVQRAEAVRPVRLDFRYDHRRP